MKTINNNRFLTNIDWFKFALKDYDVVYRHISALEVLNLFNGYIHENDIYVYSECEILFENVHTILVEDLKKIDYVNMFDLKCTSINTTFNQMFQYCLDNHVLGCQELWESLNTYYYKHDCSFEGLNIDDKYSVAFEDAKKCIDE